MSEKHNDIANSEEFKLLRAALVGYTRSNEYDSTKEDPDTYLKCKAYGDPEGECDGNEAMPKFTYNSIKWVDTSETAQLTKEQYNCLLDYYNRKYKHSFVSSDELKSDDKECIVVKNEVKRFKQIRILEETYNSSVLNSERFSYFCAYMPLDGKMVCRPGQILFFFKHDVDAFDDSKKSHYFAYVRWFRLPIPGSIDLRYHYIEDIKGPYQNTFEDPSHQSIIPVQRLYSKINIKFEFLDNINIVMFLPRNSLY